MMKSIRRHGGWRRARKEPLGLAGKLAGGSVAHVGENSAALFASAVDGAEETAGTHVLGWRRERVGNIWVGSSVRHKGTSGERLSFF